MKSRAYEIFVSDKTNSVGIHILEGKYEGVLISVNDIVVSKDLNVTDGKNLSIEFYVVNKPDNITSDDISSEEFSDVIGNIFNEFIKEALGNETRNVDSEEFDTQ